MKLNIPLAPYAMFFVGAYVHTEFSLVQYVQLVDGPPDELDELEPVPLPLVLPPPPPPLVAPSSGTGVVLTGGEGIAGVRVVGTDVLFVATLALEARVLWLADECAGTVDEGGESKSCGLTKKLATVAFVFESASVQMPGALGATCQKR